MIHMRCKKKDGGDLNNKAGHWNNLKWKGNTSQNRLKYVLSSEAATQMLWKSMLLRNKEGYSAYSLDRTVISMIFSTKLYN